MDYYNNENNEGHIFFQFINTSLNDILIKKGEAVGQGVFLPYLKSDNGNSSNVRIGGIGSTKN